MCSDLNPEAVTTLEFDCPGCGAPMEIIDRFTLYGVPAPVEHVKVRCPVGHWYTIPTEWLARADRDQQRHAASEGVTGNDHPQSVTPASAYKLPSSETTVRRTGRVIMRRITRSL